MTDLLALLRECKRKLVIFQDVSPLIANIDAAIAEHEAEPERKCGTCERWRIFSAAFRADEQTHWRQCLLYDMQTHVRMCCADWQRKEET